MNPFPSKSSNSPLSILTLFIYIKVVVSATIPSVARNLTSVRDVPFFPLLPDIPNGWMPNNLDDVPECANYQDDLPRSCFEALDVRAQGYLWIKASTCTDTQNIILTSAFRHAYTIINANRDFPIKDVHQQSAAYYMGPDWETDEYKNRITANVNRAVTFHSEAVNNYITITCNDSRNQCGKKFNGLSVGGYAFVSKHWLWWDWHYINMCDLFFTGVANSDTRVAEIKDNILNGDYQYADNAEWLQTTGSYLLHEMMHSRLIDNSPPDSHIRDESVDPNQDTKGQAAYMPYYVRLLARRKVQNGGGAKRASTNSDSYTQMMNAIYWQTITGHLPVVFGAKSAAEDENADPNLPDPTVASGLPRMVDLGELSATDDVSAAFDIASLAL